VSESRAAIERFQRACEQERLVVAAFLGGSHAAGAAREDSDIDRHVVTKSKDYRRFISRRVGFIESWGTPVKRTAAHACQR